MAKKKPSKKNVRPAPVVAMPGPDRLERDIEAGSVPAPYVPAPVVVPPVVAAPGPVPGIRGFDVPPTMITPTPVKKPEDKPGSGSGSGGDNRQAEIEALADRARGYSGDTATADYIRRLIANQGDGSGTPQQRIDALNRLIKEGKARNLALRGGEEVYASLSDPVNVTGSAVDAGAWASQIEALALEAAGLSGDPATAAYIRLLVANSGSGAGTVEERIAALKRLIEEGKARLAAGGNNGNDGKGNGNSGNSGSDGSGSGKTTWEPAKDAKNTIKAVLATYGLGGLADYLYDLYAAQKVDINRPDALLFALRDQDIYKKRFAANALRTAPNRKGGQLFELDPASYIGLENAYRQLMRSNNLPTDLFDETKDFTDLIAGDVSPQELQDRIQNGFRAVEDADPEVKRQMQQLYGVDEAGLAAYFLNPERAAPILVRRAKAAKVAARAKEQAGMQLGQLTAEEIITRGVSQEEAETAFTQLGLMKGLYTEMTGEETLTEQQKLGAVFGYDVTATKRLTQRQATRKAPFQGGGSFARTTGKTSGVTETGLGVAE